MIVITVIVYPMNMINIKLCPSSKFISLNTESKGIPQKLKVRGLQHFFHVILTDKLRMGEVRMLIFDAA